MTTSSQSMSPAGKPSARRVALAALRSWESGSRHADDVLSDLSRKHQLDHAEHALAQQLFYGVIRSLSRLDALIDRLRHGKLSRENRQLLRLGLFQLFETRIPVHAAVNETVALARHRRDRSVINGVLRHADRQREELLSWLADQPASARHSHPEFLIQRWTETFGPETTGALCEWNNQPPPVYLRLNRLLDDPAIEREIADSEVTRPVDGRPDFYQVEGAVPKAWIQRGWIYLQDPSTCLACDLLAPRPDESILDACAAPGGKTSLLATTGANVTAADREGPRLDRLGENLTRLRAGERVEFHAIDWLADDAVAAFGDRRFDAILLDVPCSNTGVMRRRVDVRWRLAPGAFATQAEQQLRIAEAVMPLLQPGGRLVYSTCSIDDEENGQVVESLLARHPSLSLEEKADLLPWRDGFDGAFAARLRLSS